MKTLSFLLLFCISFTANSQIVNIEKQRRSQPDSIHWFGYINLGFNLVENDKTIITIHGDMRHDFAKKRHSFLSISNYNLGKVEDSDFINDGFQHFRYNYSINSWLTWEAFSQVQYNERINLKLRGLLGSGPRFKILDSERYHLYFGSLYMYEYDREVEGEEETKIIHRDHRISSYLSVSFQPLDILELSSSSYYQPVLTDLNDLRLSSESRMTVRLTKHMKLTSAFSIVYDSRTPEGVPNTTYRFVNGLRWDFK